jgi:hypothetical protein
MTLFGGQHQLLKRPVVVSIVDLSSISTPSETHLLLKFFDTTSLHLKTH